MTPVCGFTLVTQKDVLSWGLGCTSAGPSPRLPSTKRYTMFVQVVENIVKEILALLINLPLLSICLPPPPEPNKLAKCSKGLKFLETKMRRTLSLLIFLALSYTFLPLSWQHVRHRKSGQVKYVC